ncbi:MAG: efflux RND transporter periplasmic adaptor subunit [Leptothrix ochracea]|uniref:efflux RND transporter periplasmic adaptor subunit n=1 Tax=Leptothrix ochracea TaxID=735331 RepID=UPI0034E2F627
MKTKKLLTLFVLLGLVMAAGLWFFRASLGLSSSGSHQAPSAATVKPPQGVGMGVAQQRDVPVMVDAMAVVEALNSVDIRPQTTGVVQRVAVREGQVVRKGEVLFVLEDRTERANLDKARAQLARDRATLHDLERQLKRSQDLLAKQVIAQSALDTVQTQLDAQQAVVQGSEAALRASDIALTDTVLRAPLTGRLGALHVTVGSLVQPTGVVMVTLNQMEPVALSLAVPERYLAGLQTLLSGPKPPSVSVVGMAAASGVTLPAGPVTFIDNAVDAATGTVRIKATVPNPGQGMLPGQSVPVRLSLRILKDVVVIAQAAIIQRGQERQIYVMAQDGTAQLRSIKVLQPLGDLVAVEGVQAGERVVVEGKQNLRPGQAIKDLPTAPGAPASGASR